MHDYYDGSWGAGQWLGMSLMMLLFWGGLTLLIVWAVRSSRGNGSVPMPATARAPRPLDVLADRFARGEIDAEEFERSRELLNRSQPS